MVPRQPLARDQIFAERDLGNKDLRDEVLLNKSSDERLGAAGRSLLNLLRAEAFPSEAPPARFWLTLLFRAGGVNLT